MSIQSVRQVLVAAFVVSLSSAALARTPPALEAQQRASAHATQGGPGYRDMNQRFGNVAERAPATQLASRGYRDIHYRFPAAGQAHQTASSDLASRFR